MMNGAVMHTCQFINTAQILLLYHQDRRPKNPVCGKAADRAVVFNSHMEPFWLCAEHYDLLLGEGWWELRTPLGKWD
jgi:hypothetical protein